MQTTRAFKLLGVNDDESTCSLCGRQELKAVMWLEDQESGEVFFVGRDCGAKLLKKTAKEFRAFEKSEVSRQRKEASDMAAANPAFQALRAKLTELDGVKFDTFAARMDILRPFLKGVDAARAEIAKLYPLAGFVTA